METCKSLKSLSYKSHLSQISHKGHSSDQVIQVLRVILVIQVSFVILINKAILDFLAIQVKSSFETDILVNQVIHENQVIQAIGVI